MKRKVCGAGLINHIKASLEASVSEVGNLLHNFVCKVTQTN